MITDVVNQSSQGAYETGRDFLNNIWNLGSQYILDRVGNSATADLEKRVATDQRKISEAKGLPVNTSKKQSGVDTVLSGFGVNANIIMIGVAVIGIIILLRKT